jgi:hypothetical protein
MAQPKKKRKPGPGRPPKPEGEKRVIVSFSAPPELAAWLDEACEARGLGRSEFIRELLERERDA